MIPLYYLYEAKQHEILYHASPVQGLTHLGVAIQKDHSGGKHKGKIATYATPDKSYASAFGINLSDDKHEFGKNNNDPWYLKIKHKKDVKDLDKPMSIYHVSGEGFKRVRTPGGTPEHIKMGDKTPVLHEERYNSVREALEKHGVKIIHPK